MSNQYVGNFCGDVECKMKKTVAQGLRELSTQGLYYAEVARIFGYKEGTVRKWCRHYGVLLASNKMTKKHIKQIETNVGIDKLFDEVRCNNFNTKNVLHKPWRLQEHHFFTNNVNR